MIFFFSCTASLELVSLSSIGLIEVSASWSFIYCLKEIVSSVKCFVNFFLLKRHDLQKTSFSLYTVSVMFLIELQSIQPAELCENCQCLPLFFFEFLNWIKWRKCIFWHLKLRRQTITANISGLLCVSLLHPLLSDTVKEIGESTDWRF